MRIFISHSTAKDDPDGCKRLDEVAAALLGPAHAATGHDVLVDKERLKAGSDWRAELDEWMATCHAAVLLLTPRALESAWVLKEATILAHRAALDTQFLLFPALLDGLTRDQLKESRFSPLYLDAIQRVAGTRPADIAMAVLQQLAKFGKPPDTRFDSLVTALAGLLKSAAEGYGLEPICERITGTPWAWDSARTRAMGAARVVALAIVSGRLGSYASLRELMNDLLNNTLSKEAATRVLNLAGPMWVKAEAAAHLAEVAARNRTKPRDATGQRVSWSTAINGELLPTFTAPQYVRRAYLPDVPTFLNLDGGQSDLKLDELITCLRHEVRKSPLFAGRSDAKIDDLLSKVDTPYFVLLPPPFPDAELLESLQARYPALTFIGQGDAPRIAAREFEGRVVPIVPPLDHDDEDKAFLEIESIRDRIESA